MTPTVPQTESEMIAALTASIARTKAQRAEAAKARREARKVVAAFLRASKFAAKRDEFSCPRCGVGTDSSYCAACDAAECGEHHVDSLDICNAELTAKGYTRLGPCYERFTFRGGESKLVKIDLWRRPDGERAFGAILEVLS